MEKNGELKEPINETEQRGMAETQEHQNDWAHREDGSRIHIDDVVETGRKGYYCPGVGCNAPMQAVKPKYRRAYFRHDAYNVDHKRTCTYSNETYRHKVAKEILQASKAIKVPAVKKFPPDDVDGMPNPIRDARIIHAHRVEIEMSFFEDENAQVKWGRPKGISEKNLFIRPDVAFFDKNGQPILLIELIATHKIDSEKSAKLRRLGIDTVRVAIPRGNETDIESVFRRTTRTSWQFNKEEYEAEYIHVPRRAEEKLSEADLQQRAVFDETFECRKADIGNLIRSLNKCVESEQYQAIELRLRSDLSKAEAATRRADREVQELRGGIRADLEGSIGDQQSALERRRESLDEKRNDLEGRYIAKREELAKDEKAVREAEARVREELEERGKVPETVEGRRDQIKSRGEAIENRRREIVELTEAAEFRRREIGEEEDTITEHLEAEGLRIQLKFDKLKANERARFKELKGDLTKRIGELKSAKEELWSEEKGDFQSIYAAESDVVQRAIECIQRRDTDPELPLPERYHKLLEARGILDAISEAHSRTKRIIAATRSIDEKTFKSWYKRP